MALIESSVSTSDDSFRSNRDGMLALIERVHRYQRRTVETSARARARYEKRGQLLPRERLALLLDTGSAFLELSTLCGLGYDTPDLEKSVSGGGVITGLGFVSGIRCAIDVSDSGIDAGAVQPFGLEKQMRVQEIALTHRLPYVQLVESAGANLMQYQVGDSLRGGGLRRKNPGQAADTSATESSATRAER